MKPIEEYIAQLKVALGKCLCSEHMQELVTETLSHLTERADELRQTGLSQVEAEEHAVREFGTVEEIAPELAKSFPPRPPIDSRRIAWLPEASVCLLLAIAGFTFSIAGGIRGVEVVAVITIPPSVMFVIPGMFGAMARLKFRRLRPLAVQTRMATYGLVISLAGTGCLLFVQRTGRGLFTELYPLYYLFAAVSVLFYVVMMTFNGEGRLVSSLRDRFRAR